MIPQTTEYPTNSQHARRLFLTYLANSVLLANGASRSALAALLGSLPAAALAQSYDVLRAQTKKYGDIYPDTGGHLDTAQCECLIRARFH